MLIVPNGFTDFSKPDGTGAYALESFEPGVRVITKRKSGDYWKPNRGNFDSVEIALHSRRGGADSGADLGPDRRRQPPRRQDGQPGHESADRGCGENQGHWQPLRLRGALRSTIPTPTTTSGSRSNTASIARRSSTAVYKGYATIGNDTTVAPSAKYFAKDIPQRPYDPEKAAFHFKKAGMAECQVRAAGLRRRLLRRDRRRGPLSGGHEEGRP